MTLDADRALDTDQSSASRLPVFDTNMCAEDMDKMMKNAQRASNFLKAISHEGRLMILCHLASGESLKTFYPPAKQRFLSNCRACGLKGL